MDVNVLIGCMAAMCFKTAISPSMFDMLGNAFAVLVLGEYGSFCATYMFERLNVINLKMT